MFSALSPRFAVPLAFSLTRYSIPALQCTVSRHICDKTLLKLDDFEKNREQTSLRLKDKDDFWLRILSLQESGHVFDEDLKMAWILAEEEHLPLLKNLAKIFLKAEKSRVSFGSFRYGSVMMRTCYHLGKPEFALEIFNDSILRKVMDETMSIILLMDLLIESSNSKAVIDVYEELSQMEWYFVLRNPIISMLYAVALYKMETNEALEKAREFSRKLVMAPQYRGKIENTLGALSLKLMNPKEALSFVSKRAALCEVAWNIKIQALIMLSDVETAVKEIQHKKQFCVFEDTEKLITSHIKKDKSLHFKSDVHKRSLDEVITTMKFEEYQDALPLRKKKKFS